MSLGRSVAFVGFAALALAAAAQAAAAPIVELPLEFEKDLPLASISVNGHELLFILDSATEGCVLEAKKAAEIGVKATDSATASGSGGMTSVGLARGVRLGLGSLEIVPDLAVLTGLEGLGFEKPVHGILGFPLFGKLVVEIDYAARRARVFDPAQYQPPPEAETLRLWMTDGPTVRGRTAAPPRRRGGTHADGTLATERFDANLGNGFLSHHVATFDIPHGRLLLRRPKLEARRFAAETIAAADCFCHTFAPDGKTVVFVKSKAGLHEARLEGGRWSEAKPLPFSGAKDVRDGDPFFSPDGSRLYFWSSREGKTSLDTDLYVVERRADGWGVPQNLGPPVNNEVNEPFPAVAADGTLYFGSARPGSGGIDLYRARPRGSGYAEPESLGPAVNSPELDLDGYVSPDQTTLVFGSNRPGGYGKIDLYVSHWQDDRWSPDL